MANVAPVPNLPRIITAGAGDGIQVLLGMQEPGQASRWQDEASVVLGGTSYLALYPGLKDARYLSDISALSGDEVQYDLEVHVRDSTPGGSRYAGESRLIRERLTIEAARQGGSSRLARVTDLRSASALAAQRKRDGIWCRSTEGPGGPSDVLEEVMSYTLIKQVPKRLPQIPVKDLSTGRPGQCYWRSRSFTGFREVRPWFKDSFWTEALGRP